MLRLDYAKADFHSNEQKSYVEYLFLVGDDDYETPFSWKSDFDNGILPLRQSIEPERSKPVCIGRDVLVEQDKGQYFVEWYG